MATDDPERGEGGGPTGPYGETLKRRRIVNEDEEEDDEGGVDNETGAASASAGGDDGGDEDVVEEEELRRRRALRLEARSADRRRRRLQAEAAELREASFPGDEFYMGECSMLILSMCGTILINSVSMK